MEGNASAARHADAASGEAARREFTVIAGRLKHDLQGILQNIGAFGDVLEESARGRLSDRELGFLHRMRAGADRGLRVLNGVVALSDVKMAEVQPRECDLAALVESCVARLAAEAPDRPVAWDLAELPVVVTDPVLLELALAQLLDNALKFTRSQAQPRIAVRASASAQACRIVISDNGVGFEQRHADRLFAPFERLHLEREFAGIGLGLGLAMVKAVADRLGGSVAIEGSAGQGARVTLRIPQLRQLAAAPARAAASVRKRVLLADDDPLSLLTLARLLERDGYEVTAVAGGLAALAALKDGAAFDCVVTDLQMPGADGLQVAAQARALSPAPRVVLLSGGVLPAAEDGRCLDVDAVLAKPIRAATLRHALREAA